MSYTTVPQKWRMANVEEDPAGGMNLGEANNIVYISLESIIECNEPQLP